MNKKEKEILKELKSLNKINPEIEEQLQRIEEMRQRLIKQQNNKGDLKWKWIK